MLPKEVKKHSLKEFNISSPKETGKSFKENSLIKAEYFSKKTNIICLSDDSGLEIDLLKGAPGIYSSRWSGPTNNFNKAFEKVFKEMSKAKKNWKNDNVKGKIAPTKRGDSGFGYDPIFISDDYNKTFAEMKPELKMSIDHRFKSYQQIKNFFN